MKTIERIDQEAKAENNARAQRATEAKKTETDHKAGLTGVKERNPDEQTQTSFDTEAQVKKVGTHIA